MTCNSRNRCSKRSPRPWRPPRSPTRVGRCWPTPATGRSPTSPRSRARPSCWSGQLGPAAPASPARTAGRRSPSATACARRCWPPHQGPGKARFAKRKEPVEPVFGQPKEQQGARRFTRRGLGVCDAEWKLRCATHNLLKLWRHLAANRHPHRPPPEPRPTLPSLAARGHRHGPGCTQRTTAALPASAGHLPVWLACVSATLRNDGPGQEHQAFVKTGAWPGGRAPGRVPTPARSTAGSPRSTRASSPSMTMCEAWHDRPDRGTLSSSPRCAGCATGSATSRSWL
jgi:hypothetical protein